MLSELQVKEIKEIFNDYKNYFYEKKDLLETIKSTKKRAATVLNVKDKVVTKIFDSLLKNEGQELDEVSTLFDELKEKV